MVEVNYTVYNGHEYKSLCVKGHASGSFGTKGNNILCSAISVLVQTLYLFLKQNSLLEKENISDGHLEIEFSKNEVKTKVAMEMLLTGIENLAKQYPRDLNLTKQLYKEEVKNGT